MAIDKAKLLDWLRERADSKTESVVQQAIYIGLAERIERGDFDDA